MHRPDAQVAGATLYCEETGSGDAAPVVLLHGFGASAEVWAGVRAALDGDYRVLAYDLPGHHRSLVYPQIGGAGRAAKAIRADLAERGIGRLHLVGHSMGGAVAALVTISAPEAVASLTLLAPGGFGREINLRLLERYAAASDEESVRRALEGMFGWEKPVPEDAVARCVALRRAPGAVEALQKILPSMTVAENGRQVQGMLPRDALAALAMPVKVLWGTQDRVLPTRQAHHLPPLFAAHIFEDTGHMLVEEQEKAVITLVRQNIRAGS